MRLSMSIVGDAEAKAVRKVICEDGYLGMGRATRDFEKELSIYLGVEPWQVISVNSGTAALQLAVASLLASLRDSGTRLPEKPAILVPSLTFIASFQAVLAGGCVPLPCDVRVETGTVDLEDAARRMSDDVIALMHVDYASNPWHLDEVYKFGSEHGITIIDDAAHAFGCRYHGRKIGSFGQLVCFSFDGIKNITCGEGGCLIAFDREQARLAADARLLGVEGDTSKRFEGGRTWEPDARHIGWRMHLSNIMAAIGSTQLARLETEFVPARRRLYELYKLLLKDTPDVVFLQTDPDDYIVPHIMPLRILNGKRNGLRDVLLEADIPCGMHYRPNHLLTLFGGGKLSLPGAERLYSELVTLPLHPGLHEDDVRLVAGKIRNYMGMKADD